MSVFDVRGDTLYMDGADLTALAGEFGTPLYVMSRTAIENKIAEIKGSFTERYPRARAAYASKAFLCTAMARIIDESGLSLDVVSGGELYTAIRAGFPADRIEFHGNNKTGEELALALRYGVGRIIIDAPDELDMIEAMLKAMGNRYVPKLLFRINPEVDTDTHSHISTGFKGSKFGFQTNDELLYRLINRAISSNAVHLQGIHFHIGSQLFTADGHIEALRHALGVMSAVNKQLRYTFEEINIGGGFGIRYTQNDDPKPYAYYLDPVMDEVADYCARNDLREPAIVVEPGRSIVGEAGITLYTVGAVKETPGVAKFVAVDGGMTDNIRPALYGAKYVAIIANKAAVDVSDTEKATVVGKCCETGDRLIDDAILAEAEGGDILAVLSTGAYGYSMANNYNKLLLPPVVMVCRGEAQLIVRGQTYEDLVSRDLLLPKPLLLTQ